MRVEYANLWLSILNRDRKSMRLHSTNLGIPGDLYGLFTCMITGRPWDSILKGIDKQKPTKGEKQFLQENFTGILPQISDVLQSVNKQMLLILKTNDLMRGIESSLKTSARMGSFRVMSKCCVNCVYDKKCKESQFKLEKLKFGLLQYWTLFKIHIYYTYLSLRQISYYFAGFF